MPLCCLRRQRALIRPLAEQGVFQSPLVVWPDTFMALGWAKRKRRASGKDVKMSVNDAAHFVRIHINREAYRSPSPTTSEALYILGGIPKHEKLYREAGGDKEDELVPRDDALVHFNENEHFYSREVFSIFVNADEHDIVEKEIFYTQVVALYLGDGGKPSNEFLIKYSHGPMENPSGTLAPGQKVKVKDGMRFRVSGTGES